MTDRGEPSANLVYGIRLSGRSERMSHADGGAPVFVKPAAARTFDVRPEAGGGRQVEVGAEAVFNPSVLAVDLDDARAAGSRALDPAVTQELVHDGRAEVDVTLVVRALDAGRKAETPRQAVKTFDLVTCFAKGEVITVDVGVDNFSLRFDIEHAGEIHAPSAFSGDADRQAVHLSLHGAVDRHVIVKLGHADHRVEEHAVVGHPRRITSKTVALHVGRTADIIHFTVRVAGA